jgi:hypothetical protein
MMSPFYRRSVTGRLQTGEFLMNAQRVGAGVAIAENGGKNGREQEFGSRGLVCRLQVRDLAGKQGVCRELTPQTC